MSIDLKPLDFVIISIYFIAILLVAKWASKKDTSDDYFLAGRDLGWFAIGASLFASNIGSEHLIGLSGSGFSSGVAVSQFEILAGFILLVLGWIFVPFYLKSQVTTMPEFLEIRYGRAARNYLSFISVVAYVLTKISATIFAGAIVFEAMGLPFWVGAGVTVAVTGFYTLLGGMKAVIYTDVAQLFIMIAGSIAVSVFGLHALGGVSEFKSLIEPEFFNLWKPSTDASFPWTGILFGAPILGVWYWCTDQFIVQRVLSAKNQAQARRGTLFAGYLKMLPLFLFVVPGMIALALSEKGLLTVSQSDHALPSLVAFVLPVGIKGLVIAGLLAALMSSLSSVFNSCSTLITYDWYKVRNPEASEKRLIRVGQLATLVLVIFGMLWIPLMKHISGSLFTYIQSVQAYISPPIAAVFLLGLFVKRLNLAGAMASLGTGFFLGVLRLILEINKDSLSGFWLGFATINFLHFALFLFVVCSVVLIVVSLFAKAPDLEKIKNVVYVKSKKKDASKRSDLVLSFGLLIIIFFTWWYLS